MQDNNSKGYTGFAQLGIFVGMIGAGMIIASILSAGIWSAMTHQPLVLMQTGMTNPKYYAAVMTIQAVSTVFMMFLPVVFFAMVCYHRPALFIGNLTPVTTRQLLIVAGIVIVIFPLGASLAEINRVIPLPKDLASRFQRMEDERKAMEDVFININSFSKYVASLLVIAVLPAIVEEFCFRAGLQNILERWFGKALTAIVVTSVIFSLIHMSYYGFLVRFALGLVLGYIYYFSGSIWLSVFLHFLFNGIQVTAMYISKAFEKPGVKDIDENFPLWVGLPALILIILLFQLFYKESQRLQRKYLYDEPEDPDDIHDWIA